MTKFTKWFNEMLIDVDNYEIENTNCKKSK